MIVRDFIIIGGMALSVCMGSVEPVKAEGNSGAGLKAGATQDARAAADAVFTTTPAKNSAYGYVEDIGVPTGAVDACPYGVVLSVTIAKGSKGRVVAIEAMLGADGGLSGSSRIALPYEHRLTMFPTVNGVLTPGILSSSQDCVSNRVCELAGTWWLDLDAAEAANPGKFLKQPLKVDLLGCVAFRGATPTVAPIGGPISLTARLEKK